MVAFADLKFLNAAIVKGAAGPIVWLVQGIDDKGPFEYGGYFGKRRITEENFIAGFTCIVTALREKEKIENNA